jgi:DNA-binding MarR family transcriptional regulator
MPVSSSVCGLGHGLRAKIFKCATKLEKQPPVQGTHTARQGQYLAFIYYYTKIHRQPPAEADMQRYFHVSPPAVHQMILSLEKSVLIERIPGKGRSLKLLLLREQLPDLL